MKRRLLVVVVAALVAAGFQGPAWAASALKVSGAATAASGANYTATVTLTPKKSNVSVTLYRVTMGSRVKLGAGKTNSAGKATIKFKVTATTLKLQAFVTSNSATKSGIFEVTVMTPTKVTANLPSTVGCTDVTVTARVTPKTSGRTVQMQWWDAESDSWTTESTATTDGGGIAYLTLGVADGSGTLSHRVVVLAKAGFSAAVSATKSVYFEDCGGSSDGWTFTASIDSGTSLYSGDYFELSWELVADDWNQFADGNVAVLFEVCDNYLGDCDASDPDMSPYYDSVVEDITWDDYGSFGWTAEQGRWVVRVSLWDAGEMLDYRWDYLDVS